jgi:hypothetical protein
MGSRSRRTHDLHMGGPTKGNGSTSEGNAVPAEWVWQTRLRIGQWAAAFLGLLSASLVKVHWVSICSGEQSDFVGLFKGDTYESVDIEDSVKSAFTGREATTDFVMDARFLDFTKLAAAAKENFPQAHVIVFACWPPCTCFCTLNIGTNQKHMELKGVQPDGTMIWGPKGGYLGKRARGDTSLFDHILDSSGHLANMHFQ